MEICAQIFFSWRKAVESANSGGSTFEGLHAGWKQPWIEIKILKETPTRYQNHPTNDGRNCWKHKRHRTHWCWWQNDPSGMQTKSYIFMEYPWLSRFLLSIHIYIYIIFIEREMYIYISTYISCIYIYIHTYPTKQHTKQDLHKEAANPSPLCFNRIYRNSGPSWNGHWAQQHGHPGVGWSSWWLSQPIREGGLPQSLETTLKNWRSPAPTNDTCPPPLELSFPCDKMPMVDPGKICERQIGSCSQIWMTLFKKMFEKVHNNPVSVCFFWGEMKVIDVHGTQNKSPGVPKNLLLTKNLPGKHLFPPPHTQPK